MDIEIISSQSYYEINWKLLPIYRIRDNKETSESLFGYFITARGNCQWLKCMIITVDISAMSVKVGANRVGWVDRPVETLSCYVILLVLKYF